jgi:hypothetical protein
MDNNKNIIIHTYSSSCKTVPVPPGFADFLRGTMYLYQESQTNNKNIDLIVDFSRHPISKFINTPNKNTQELYQKILEDYETSEIVECFHKDNYKIKDIVKKSSNPPTRVFTFEWYKEFNTQDSLPPYLKDYMQELLDFNQDIREDADYILKTQLNLNPNEFCVLHLRIGDHMSCQESVPIPPNIENYIETEILPTWGKKVLIISDSYYIKTYLKTKYNLPATDFIPVHLGTTKTFLTSQDGYGTSDTDIGQTVIEFIMMSKAKQIYLYSVYDWGSGFSYICSHIYGIPYKRILCP